MQWVNCEYMEALEICVFILSQECDTLLYMKTNEVKNLMSRNKYVSFKT